MMYRDDDALDRALFALPLEEPPADLRASILTSTVYRPAPAFSFWEITGLGVIAAVLVWLVALIAMGGGTLFVQTISAIASSLARPLSNVTTLAWLAAGAATAFWLTFFTGSQPFMLASQRVGQRAR
ncbi:MAG TPA: hypothetical protein VFE36_07870 [Candidatus Baltobacteraceae bacterium]|jgi:hypothetical protein|nr:hypothetical protein [Candidatus Baltobacteraceae bacterium]